MTGTSQKFSYHHGDLKRVPREQGEGTLSLSSLLKKASCLFQNSKSKKRGFCFSHKIKGLRAFDFVETSMFRCRRSKFSEFQQPARRLAANMGGSRTAPCNHLKDKDALHSALAAEGFSRYAAPIAAGQKRARRLDGLGQTRAVVRTYIDYARKKPEHFDLMYGRKSWRCTDPAKSLAVTARTILHADVERLKSHQQRGQIKADMDVPRFVQVHWGTLHGISRLLLDGVYRISSL